MRTSIGLDTNLSEPLYATPGSWYAQNLRCRIEKAHRHAQDATQKPVMKRHSTPEGADNVRHVVDSNIGNKEHDHDGCVSSKEEECRTIISALIRLYPIT